MTSTDCFLCNPNEKLIFYRDDPFFVMLGLGAILEGFSIISTSFHIRSFIDIDEEYVDNLILFKDKVRDILGNLYGEIIITEHGRVPPCTQTVTRKENHCFHAHYLVFPIEFDLEREIKEFGFSVSKYSSFKEARQEYKWKNEYIYFEKKDRHCLIGHSPLGVPRQFFRHLIAEIVGKPEWSDWRKYPNVTLIEKALKRIKGDNYYENLDT